MFSKQLKMENWNVEGKYSLRMRGYKIFKQYYLLN